MWQICSLRLQLQQALLLCLSTYCYSIQAKQIKRDQTSVQTQDLTSFISRPDIRAPMWNISKHIPDKISEGYWFVTPYTEWDSVPDRHEYIPYQIGPHIYDGDGDLVWSGANLEYNRNAHDFRTYHTSNGTFMSYCLAKAPRGFDPRPEGMFVMMDTSYSQVRDIEPWEKEDFYINCHEFNVIDDGRHALIFKTRHFNFTEPAFQSLSRRGYRDDCIVEFDTVSTDVNFEWCPSEHGVLIEETYDEPDDREAWDWFHGNSIDKFPNSGDYIVSSRLVQTIFRVSRIDKTINWRLGGKHSDFTMDFNFSSQHNARILSENSTTTILSLFDNAANTGPYERNRTADASSGKVIALYTSERPMRAKLLKEWDRPDGDLTKLRGNLQMLLNGNVFVGWSMGGYMSEHTADGEVLLEASFKSPRYSSYRAYKYPFVGKPLDKPALKAFQFEMNGEDGSVVAYVSWNGATEVSYWQFIGHHLDANHSVEIAMVKKTGFETLLTATGIWNNVSAIALDADGVRLGESNGTATILIKSDSIEDSVGTQTTSTITHTVVEAANSIFKMRHLSSWALVIGAIILTLGLQALAYTIFVVYKRLQRGRRWYSGLSGATDGEPEEAGVPFLQAEKDSPWSDQGP